MQTRRAGTTFTDFVLRFIALIALTVAVLMGVAVRARDSQPEADKRATVATRESAADINSRRYPLVHADAGSSN